MSLTTKSIDFAITKAPQVINTTTEAISKAVGSIFTSTPTRTAVQYASSGTSQAVSQITRHGLEEIVVEARLMDKGGMITHEGARISHPAPVRAVYPHDPHVIVGDEVFYYRYKMGPNGCAVRHEIQRLPNGDIHIKFFDKTGTWVDSVEKVKYDPKTRPITDKNEIAKLLEESRKNPPKPAEVLPEITEPHFQGFKKPEGATSCARITAQDGTSTVVFRDKDGNLLREIKCDKSGYPIEYTNYERKFENIKGQITRDENGRAIPIPGKSKYDEVVTSSTYRINDKEVLGTTQIREVTSHGYTSGQTLKTTVERRGKFEEVTIECGDKKINEFFFTSGAAKKGRLAANHTKGLTEEEIRLIQSDPYLSSRYYNDGLEFVESSRPIIYGQEGIRNPERTIMTYEPPSNGENGWHRANWRVNGAPERVGGQINMTPSYVEKGKKCDVINTEAHETRHAHQYDIMEDRRNGKLTGEEKAFADEIQHAHDNYVPSDVDYDAYWNNKKEVDARRRGQEVQDLFETHGENQRRIFTA